MQAVDPSVSLPYWDFTIEYHNEAYEGTPWEASEVFGEGMFGAATSSRADHAIDSSSWKLTPVLNVIFSFSYNIYFSPPLTRTRQRLDTTTPSIRFTTPMAY